MSGDGKMLAWPADSHHVGLASMQAGLAAPPQARGAIRDVAVSWSRVAYTTGVRAEIRLADWRSGRAQGWLEGHVGAPVLLGFTPEGRLISASRDTQDSSVSVWDTAKLDEVQRIRTVKP